MAQLGRKRQKEEVDTELNMVPIMNMFMVLIPFLLMSAAFYHIKAVNTSIPVHGNKSAGSSPVKEKEDIKITVVLALKAEKINISALSDELAPEALAELETTIERPSGADLSAGALTDFLKMIKNRYPASDTLLLIPDDNISYDEIIQAMDCARNRDTEALFPNVVLSGSLG